MTGIEGISYVDVCTFMKAFRGILLRMRNISHETCNNNDNNNNNNNNNILTVIVLSPGSSGYFTCIQNMKLVTNKFKSGGLHEKHVVATWNVGNRLSVCL